MNQVIKIKIEREEIECKPAWVCTLTGENDSLITDGVGWSPMMALEDALLTAAGDKKSAAVDKK